MATTLEIIDCISQVLSNTYDGALDESGEPIKIGLRREEGNPLTDHRVATDSTSSIMLRYHSKRFIPMGLRERWNQWWKK